MSIYRVFYGSMTAHYGPHFVEASSEEEARRKFARTAFSDREMPLIHATLVSEADARRALLKMAKEEREI